MEDPLASTRGCTVRALRALSGRVYVACGLGGVWILAPEATEFTILERRDLGGNVSGFFEQGNQLWAVVERTEARPITSLSTGPARPEDLTPPTDRFPRIAVSPQESVAHMLGERPASPVQELPAVEGRVVRLDGREVIVDLGTSDGLRPGTRIEFSKDKAHPDVSEDLGESAFVQLAVGVVRSAGAHRARVALGLNESVPLGAYARPTKAPTSASTSGPPRVRGVWEASGLFRLFAALDELGGGFLLDAAFGYRFEDNFHVEGQVLPLGIATAEEGGIGTLTAFVLANYDTRLFEIGTGLGAQTVNDPDFDEQTGSGMVFPQHLRLGAQDGVNLDLLSTAVLFRQRFRFSGFRASLQVPLSDAGWLVLFRGGGGTAGYAFGELAVRALLSGNGHADSSFLIASLGGVGLFKSTPCMIAPGQFSSCDGEISYAGPTFGVGLERRF